jgi:hypothetical protein
MSQGRKETVSKYRDKLVGNGMWMGNKVGQISDSRKRDK